MTHQRFLGDEAFYAVDGDRPMVDLGGRIVDTSTVRVDADGTLDLTARHATDPGGVFVMTSKAWNRIADGTDTTATVLDGTFAGH